MELPVYELKINPEENSFVDAIAFVESPAIESGWLAFSKEQVNVTFSRNDERKELIGAALIPDLKIFRRDQDGKEYNVFFSKETIRQIAQVFFKKGFQDNLNLDHTATPAKSYVFQSYIVDKEKGMTSPKGLNLPDGSWVIGVKCEDDAIWNEVKEGKRTGFSIEGMFDYFKKTEKTEEQELDEMLAMFEALIINKLKSKK